jgi:hypothetical protein
MSENLIVPTMAEMLAQGKQPEVLFWVGCAGVLMIEQKNKSICTNFESCNVPLQYSVPKRVAQVIRQKSRK